MTPPNQHARFATDFKFPTTKIVCLSILVNTQHEIIKAVMMELLRAVVWFAASWFDGILITNQVLSYSNFFLYVSQSQWFLPIWILIVLICKIYETSRNKLKKHSVTKKLFWPFTVWISCSSNLNFFENFRPSVSNFKSFSQSLEQFFLTVGQNNFGNEVPFLAKVHN